MPKILGFWVPPNQIRWYRKKRKLRIKDVAALMEMLSPSHVAHWEKGRKVPSLANALKLSVAIGCPVEVLFFDQFQEIRKKMSIQRKEHNLSTFFNN